MAWGITLSLLFFSFLVASVTNPLIFFVCWGLAGAGSFYYWWTKDYTFHKRDLIIWKFTLGAAMMGPLSFTICYYTRK